MPEYNDLAKLYDLDTLSEKQKKELREHSSRTIAAMSLPATQQTRDAIIGEGIRDHIENKHPGLTRFSSPSREEIYFMHFAALELSGELGKLLANDTTVEAVRSTLTSLSQKAQAVLQSR